jgi:hypothetical protein
MRPWNPIASACTATPATYPMVVTTVVVHHCLFRTGDWGAWIAGPLRRPISDYAQRWARRGDHACRLRRTARARHLRRRYATACAPIMRLWRSERTCRRNEKGRGSGKAADRRIDPVSAAASARSPAQDADAERRPWLVELSSARGSASLVAPPGRFGGRSLHWRFPCTVYGGESLAWPAR